jgi:hypothetical protein
VLTAELGNDRHQALRLLEQHLAGLPEEQQRSIAERVRADPKASLDVLLQLVGPLPANLEAAKAEVAAARKRMASDRTWHNDDRAQLRFRATIEHFPEATTKGADDGL